MSNYCKECYKKQEEIEQLQVENEKLKEATDGLLNIQYTLADSCKKYSECLEEIRRKCQMTSVFGADDIRDIFNKISEVL